MTVDPGKNCDSKMKDCPQQGQLNRFRKPWWNGTVREGGSSRLLDVF